MNVVGFLHAYRVLWETIHDFSQIAVYGRENGHIKQHLAGDQRPEPAAVVRVHREILQAAVVHPDDPRPCPEGSFRLRLVVDLHQCGQAQLIAGVQVLPDLPLRQNGPISGQEGFESLKQILKIDPQAIVIFMGLQ